MKNKEKMRPNKELLKFAKEKSKMLKPQECIRLKGSEYENSYYLFNFLGASYIGYYMNEPLNKFFKNKKVYQLTDNITKKVIAKIQKLNK